MARFVEAFQGSPLLTVNFELWAPNSFARLEIRALHGSFDADEERPRLPTSGDASVVTSNTAQSSGSSVRGPDISLFFCLFEYLVW